MDLTRSPAGRRVLFTAYYFVEGAPIGFLWWTLPSLARAEGVGTERIGALLGWLVLPWALKWLWAPLVDRGLGRRLGLRGWIVASQLVMVASLLPLLGAADLLESDLLLAALVIHALAASTQDAAIDALVIRTTEPEERGSLAAWMQAGMLGGRSLLGGGALLVLERTGGRAVVACLLAVVALGLGLALLYRTPIPEELPRGGWAGTLRAVLSRRLTWSGLALGATAGAGFEAVGAFAGPLLTERGGVEVAGRFFLLPAVASMVVGGLLAGRVVRALGARAATQRAALLLCAAILAFALRVRSSDAEVDALLPWLAAVYVAIGAFTAASYALFMGWTDRRHAATQFSAYMGATNLCESWAAFVAGGLLIPAAGYAAAFALLALFGLVAALLLLRRRAP